MAEKLPGEGAKWKKKKICQKQSKQSSMRL